jgi:hypothetical protein
VRHAARVGSDPLRAGVDRRPDVAYRRVAAPAALPPGHRAHVDLRLLGIYWTPIRDAAPLIAAQIVFAYAFDMLLAWSRRDTYTLGFGPFPIIYSTNLFMRFRDDWFHLQFAMVAVGFLAKELIRWEKDGRRTHIFNPSSFALALFSAVLILTGLTRITWGEEIATLLIVPPQIYLFIFLVALPGQFLFRVTTMTLPAVVTTYLFSVLYLRLTGTYFFFDSNVPIAVFLGRHLLFHQSCDAASAALRRSIGVGLQRAGHSGCHRTREDTGARPPTATRLQPRVPRRLRQCRRARGRIHPGPRRAAAVGLSHPAS